MPGARKHVPPQRPRVTATRGCRGGPGLVGPSSSSNKSVAPTAVRLSRRTAETIAEIHRRVGSMCPIRMRYTCWRL